MGLAGDDLQAWRPDLSALEGPKFRALATALREAARSGQLAPGTRLPPMRDLAWQLGVTTGTVARAYQVAAAEGVIESHVGRGSFIAAPRPRQPALQPLLYEAADGSADGVTIGAAVGAGAPGLADLRVPRLPDCGQAALIGRHMTALAGALQADILDYTPLSRDLRCRTAVLGWMARRELGSAAEPDLVLTHGGQHAITLVMSLTLGDAPAGVMLEALTYPGMRHAAQLMRAPVLPVAMDGEGMRPDDLDRVARSSGARLVCLTPSAQNPTLAAMGAARRAEIVAVARHHDLQILEDECYAPDTPAPSLRALAPERVWHVASLSKIIAAGLRFGMLLCPEGMGQAGRIAAQHSLMGLSLPITGLVTRLLCSGDADEIARRVQAEVEARLTLARACLAPLEPRTQPGVPILWLPLPPPWRARDYAARAALAGVVVRPAEEFRAAPDAPAPEAVRIALDCRMPGEQLAASLRLLAQLALASPLEGPD